MRILLNASLLALVSLLTSLPVVAAEPVQVRVVTPFAQGHILVQTAERFRQELGRLAPHIQISVQAGVLNEQTIDPAFGKCDVRDRVGEILLTGGQPIQDYAPAYFFFNGPYVIRDFAHLQKVWHSPVGVSMQKAIEANGNMVLFDPVYRGFRQFTANRDLRGPADFKEVKLRLPPVPDWIAVWQSLGVRPVQVPLPGIYASLREGKTAASEGDLTQIQSLKLNEVQSHLILTNHLVGFGMPLANACFFRKELGQSDREAISLALKKSIEWGSQSSASHEEETLAALKAGGMTIVRPDARAIRDSAKPAIDHLFATTWTVTTWKAILAQ